MPTLAQRILAELKASRTPLDDDVLGARLGVIRQSINQECRLLFGRGVIRRGKLLGITKIVNWVDSGEPPPSSSEPIERARPATVASGAEFEEYAREVLCRAWGLRLTRQSISLDRGVVHSFDFVSDDGTVIGDAKWFKNLQPSPSAKLSVISEYVWLLQQAAGAARRFLVFGHDRAVPEGWLRRFRPLLQDVEFWYLADDDGGPERL